MSLREIKTEDLVGKTIESFDNSAVNLLILKFTDGTTLELWSEEAISTNYGSIHGFYVEDSQSS